jgi:hypothetical protein
MRFGHLMIFRIILLTAIAGVIHGKLMTVLWFMSHWIAVNLMSLMPFARLRMLE